MSTQSAATVLTTVGPNGWDLAKEATTLRKKGDIAASIALASESLTRFPNFEPLQSSLCWSLYTRDIKSLGDTPTVNELRQGWRTCKEIHKLLCADLYGEFSAWIPSVLTVASAMLNHAGGNTTNMLRSAQDMLQEMDATKLSTEGFLAIPSPAERHALGITKAYHRLQEWEQLRKSCESALQLLPSGSDSELWLRHRLGIACLELDDALSAAPHLAHVVQRKPNEWWAHYNDGLAKAAIGNQSGAIWSFATALKGGSLQMKTSVMVDLADILRVQGNVEAANRHHLVARKIRLDQGWSSTSEIDAPLAPDEISTPQDLHKLKLLWDELTPEERHQAQIHTVFKNGGSGFLNLDGGESVYFTMKPGESALPKGTEVTCRVVDSFDKKKQQTSKKAIDLRAASLG